MDGSVIKLEKAVTATRAKWQTLEHKGVAFPPEYQPRGIVVMIKGEKLPLNRDQEELVYAWAKKKDTHYVQDPTFQANFMSDLRPFLPEKYRNITMKDIDFSTAYKLADEEKRMKDHEKEKYKTLAKEEKKKISQAKKAERERLRQSVNDLTLKYNLLVEHSRGKRNSD